MLGTIIGAGVFAVPLAMKGPGILLGSIVFWTIALVMLATHLLYAEVILSEKQMTASRMPGQAKRVLGPWAEWVAYISHPLQIIGACLAYVILGGEFLSVLAGSIGLPAQPILWQILFWCGGAITVFVGLKFVVKVESYTVWALIVLLLIAVGFFVSGADGRLFLEAHWAEVLSPLGIFLFALSGWPVVTEVVSLCQRDPLRSRLAVTIGTLSAALLTWLFGVFGFAALGDRLTTDPVAIMHAFPSILFWVIPAVGFFSVASAFLSMMEDLKATLHLDAKLPKLPSWALALVGPLALLFLVTRDFLGTVSLVGTVFGGMNGFLIAAMALRVRARERQRGWIRFILPSGLVGLFLGVLIWRMMILI